MSVSYEWRQVLLSEICIVDWGNTELTKSAFVSDGAFIGVSAAGCDGRIAHAEHKAGTPVLSAIGARCGAMFFPDEDFTAIKNTITLTPRAGVADGKFLYYLFTYIELPKRGAAQPFISKGDIQAFSVGIPPLVEQRRIVAILDEAFEGIAQATANAERNLANVEELFDSNLQAAFDLRESKGRTLALSDVCDIESKLVDPKQPEFANLVHVGGANMVTKSDELIDLKTARQEGLISGKFVFDQSMVLYSKIRPYLMKVSRPEFIGLCSADVYPLKARADVLDRNYLFFLLLTKKFTNYAIAGSGRAGMPKVNRDHLFAYQLNLPTLADQREAILRIEQVLSARSLLRDIYRSKLNVLAELKQSLLHKAFSGELTGKEAIAA